MAGMLEKDRSRTRILLVMAEKGSRFGMCHEIHWIATYSNKYVKDYGANKVFLNLIYLESRNLYGHTL